MKRLISALLLIAASFCLPYSARPQMGMDMFKKPSFTKVFNPVVGKGAEYQTIKADSQNYPANHADVHRRKRIRRRKRWLLDGNRDHHREGREFRRQDAIHER